jgi:hypothetical protein
VDVCLVTEENLKRFIVEDLKNREKYPHRRSFEKYGGNWTYEDFGQGRDDELFQEIIGEMQSHRTTYDDYNDLILLPEDALITVKEERLTDVIFRVFNPWLCTQDVIVHDAKFTRYVIDVQKYHELLGLEDFRYYEFTGYDFKGVLMNFFCGLDNEIDTYNYKIERLSGKLAGKQTPKQGYIDDYIDPNDEWLAAEIEESKKIVAHLQEKVPKQKDDYREHIYIADYENWDTIFRDSIENDDKDYTQLEYDLLLMDTSDYVCSGYKEAALPHRFDEIFKSKCNVEFLLCSCTGAGDTTDFGKINVMRTLSRVFGFD